MESESRAALATSGERAHPVRNPRPATAARAPDAGAAARSGRGATSAWSYARNCCAIGQAAGGTGHRLPGAALRDPDRCVRRSEHDDGAGELSDLGAGECGGIRAGADLGGTGGGSDAAIRDFTRGAAALATSERRGAAADGAGAGNGARGCAFEHAHELGRAAGGAKRVFATYN